MADVMFGPWGEETPVFFRIGGIVGVRAVVAACLWATVVTSAGAQTITLSAPDTQVTDCTIRGGTYANTINNGARLETRASTNLEYLRRSLLKFDTETTLAKGTSIQSATLTVTLKGAGSTTSGTRTIGVFPVLQSFQENEATWMRRKTSYAWTQAGGDLGAAVATATVGVTAGQKVTFDVTAYVQAAVNGTYSSRYARLALVDTGGSTSASYREFHASEATDPATRPTLTVTLGTATPTTTTPTSGTTGTVRLLHWNTHHGGVGTDGKYDPARLVAWIATFSADIISLNEVDNTTQVNAIVSRLNAATGITWKTSFSGWGNLLLTRLSLDAQSVCLFNPTAGRKAAHLRTLVNGRPLNVWSAHLAVDSASARLSEVKALQACALDWPEARIIAGDYNMQASSSEYAAMAQTYGDAWPLAKAVGAALNYPGNCDGCTRNSRIDYVFGSKGATFLAVQAARIYDTRDANGVMPSDHKPMVVTYTVK